MPLGPLMIGLPGPELSAVDREQLCHPAVGGAILFTRNYQSPEQLTALNQTIHGLREPRLLIAVDHEGGRVQRFRAGFTPLPAARQIGLTWSQDPSAARSLAHQLGWMLAAELRAVGVDFSFAPILDLDYAQSHVIGDRAFHRNPDVVTELAAACMQGMDSAGMIAVGKHFPGHGSVSADSHLELPIDRRRYADLLMDDLRPFERLIHYGIAALMPAHIVYPHIDAAPAGFSRRWIHDILRSELGFQGAIISDDLDMAGAAWAGGPIERAQQALGAGCDLALICNNFAAIATVLEHFNPPLDPVSQSRRSRLHGRNRHASLRQLQATHDWQSINRKLLKACEIIDNTQ